MIKHGVIGVICLLFFVSGWTAQAQTGITGKVLGKQEEPIEGAYVRVLNTNLTAVTNAQGEFTLSLAPGPYVAFVTAVGYAAHEEKFAVSPTSQALVIDLQEATVILEDVVVTAQKQEDDLQRVPYSITALSGKKLEEFRVWNTQDITAIVPNLYSSNPGDNRNVTSLRGIGTTSYDPAVATYIDGVNQFGLDTYLASLFDVERIEILRGPQGTLYGRNALGGVVNIVTRQPSNDFGGYAEASLGDYGQQRYSLAVRAPLVKDKLFLGVAGMYDRADGFYTNTFDDTDFAKRHSLTGNYYLTYRARPNWSITLNVKHHAHRNNGPFTLRGSAAEALENPYTVNQNARTEMVDNIFNSSLNTQHHGRAVSFQSVSTYQANYRYYKTPIDGDFSPADIATLENNYGRDWNRVQVYTQEFKLSSPAASVSPLTWTAGTYLYYQDNPVKQATRFGEMGYLYGGEPHTASIVSSTGENKGIAFYGQATYTISRVLDITAGIRYDHERREQQVLGEYRPSLDAPEVAVFQPDTSASMSYNAISPKAGLTYHIHDNSSVYAVYSRGFRTGGLTAFTGDPTQPGLFEYAPEYSNNMEIGAKNIFFENRLRVNLALFYSNVDDIQVSTLVLPEGVAVTRNAGKLTSKGIELELSATPVRGLQIDASSGYTDASYNRLTLAVRNEEGGFDSFDFKRNKQLYTPRTTSMFAAQYTYPLTAWQSLRAVVRGELVHLGEQYFDLANSNRQADYSLYNARVGVAASTFEIMFWGRNLGDKLYIAYAYDTGATRLGDPRNWGVTVRKSF
ncbi:TonB-dependent receptor [Parachryseolinea silvisoli]|uniref:TonB-dependent receptor n=1 Tax=Parachryseolinea silvisoli TaxID=2873601 RepID=UPI002265C5DF|nr:TonB-dependent receptor [Parachryseolinea silvisoli]MCD9017437.1 TonB-dependent receptor [Parachryseolinea silvisoli]